MESRRFLPMLCAALAASPAAANLPPPIVPHAYYGPVRMCGDAFSFDAGEGEAYSDQGLPVLFFPGGGLLLESWIYDHIDIGNVIERLGTVELPGGARLERVRLSWGDRPPELMYHYRRPNSYSSTLSIRSGQFDGTDRDIALLSRITFGEPAKALCASVPEALLPTPERDTRDAETFDPRPRPGPLTVCAAGLALNVTEGESVFLPWVPELRHFRLVSRSGQRTDVDAVLWSPLAGAAPGAPVEGQPKVHLIEGAALTNTYGPPPGDERMRHLRFVQEDPDVGLVHPNSNPQIIFAFDPAMPEAEARAIMARLRVHGPGEACAAEGPAEAKIGAVTPGPSR